MDGLIAAWQGLAGKWKWCGDSLLLLNPSCSAEVLREAERSLGFEMPESLAGLLKLNNGQRLEGKGLFKSPSGWDRYRRQLFLDAASIAAAYRTFIADDLLRQEFGDMEVPFAADRPGFSQGELFTVNRETQKVSLIWTETWDPFNPPEWQVERRDRGESLTAFVRWQTTMY